MQAHILRQLGVDVLSRVLDSGAQADGALARALRGQRALHSTERRLLAEAVYGAVRWHRRWDAELGRHVALSTLSTTTLHRWRLALGFVREAGVAPELAAGLGALSTPQERDLLRTLQTPADPATPSMSPVQALALRTSVPDTVAQAFHTEYGDRAEALLLALNARAPLTLRTNTLRTTRETLLDRLRADGLEAEPGNWSPWSVRLLSRVNALTLPAYADGWFEIQDEGSQCIALAAGVRRRQRVIDWCAGGGGKTLALAAAMDNTGTLLACDVSEARLADVRPRCRTAGVDNATVRVVDPRSPVDEAMWDHLDRADVVLVDAPCSGTGAWRRQPEARWRLTPAEAASYPPRQLEILSRAARCVKPGGRLLYATCSLLDAENGAVARAFEGGHPQFERAPLPVPGALLSPEGWMRTAPDLHGTDGFFVAGWVRGRTT